MDICNIKPGRVGGARVATQLAEYCRNVGMAAHLGGMLETGIGRWANARLAAEVLSDACHDMTVPGDYLTKDVLDTPLVLDPREGTVSLQDTPAPVNRQAVEEATVWRWSARAEVRGRADA
jgi:O-succinylbenzoate synthase